MARNLEQAERYREIPDKQRVETNTQIENLLRQLSTELGGSKLRVLRIERLLSEIYRLQAKVIDPSIDNRFILWQQFKEKHEILFGKALGAILQKKLATAGVHIGAVIGIPKSGTWVGEVVADYFPDAQRPRCSKEPLGSNCIAINSLTYTKRDENGNRVSELIFLEQYDPNQGPILLVEDVLATGKSGQLFVQDLQQHFDIGPGEVIYAAAVSMEEQLGRQLLTENAVIRQVYAPIRVVDVEEEKQIITHR